MLKLVIFITNKPCSKCLYEDDEMCKRQLIDDFAGDKRYPSCYEERMGLTHLYHES